MYNLITKKDIKHRKYLEIFDKIDSALFPGMSLKKILFNEAYYCQSVKFILKSFLKYLFLSPANFETKIEGNKLLCIYSRNYRYDHDNYWRAIKEDAGPHDDIVINWKISNVMQRIDLFSCFSKLKWYFHAYFELKGILSKHDRSFLAIQMMKRKWVLERIKKLNIHPNIVMCFFDSAPDENVLMQYFKQQGAITITNQHGQSVYQSYEYDLVNQSQIFNFKCDYYLAKGEMQREQFVKAGFDPNRIKLLGVVGGRNGKTRHNKLFCFGVYLDCPSLPYAEKSNSEMINLAKEVAKKINYKYLIKIHPAEIEGKYNHMIDENCVGIYGKDALLNETFEKIDFGIIHESATYVDIYFYGLRCFRFLTEIPYDISYKDDVFRDSDELKEKILRWNNLDANLKNDYIKKVRKLYDSGWEKGKLEKIVNEIDVKNNR